MSAAPIDDAPGARPVGYTQSEAGHPGPGVMAWVWRPRTQLRASIAAGVLLLIGIVIEKTTPLDALGSGLVWASLSIGMVYGLRAAAEALSARTVDIDVLMVVGAGLAAWINHPEEGALLLFLFTLSGALEDLALARTRREIEALHRLMPQEAIVWRDGAWAACAPDGLVAGDRVRIRPGDIVPVDARVSVGASAVDQSTLTGESLPREVGPGDAVYSGTVNLDRALEALVLRPESESSLRKILRLVTEARQQREPIQRLMDRLSQPYAIGVMAASAAVLLVWWLLFREPFSGAAYTAITFLIVLSPCALIIATPTATLTTIARGARAGVLFKGGQAIERLARVGAVCFDKTGTLTVGKPTLVAIEPVGWSDSARLLSVAAALEADSTHPIARAVREAASARGLTPAPVTDAVHTAGRGIRAVLAGDEVAVGDEAFVHDIVPVCLRARVKEVLALTRALAEAYRKEYGNYILLPTSFGIGNNVMGGDMGLQLTKRHSGKLTKELVRFMEGQAEQNLVVFKEYLDFLPHIARAFPETNFVIRPHPSEAHDAWKNLAADFPNLHLRYEGSVTPWILGAAAMFHFKSTTSVEAHIMGRKAITYVPPLPPYMDKYELELPMAVSRVARSRDALMQILRDVLKEERFVKPGAIDGVLGEWISVDPGRSSAARIVGKLEEYAPKPQRMWGAVEARKSFREKVERGLSSLDKTSARAYLPGRIRARLNSLSYGAHKASGMDISHTRKIIQTIGKKCGPDHVSVSALSEDVFVIKKDS